MQTHPRIMRLPNLNCIFYKQDNWNNCVILHYFKQHAQIIGWLKPSTHTIDLMTLPCFHFFMAIIWSLGVMNQCVLKLTTVQSNQWMVWNFFRLTYVWLKQRNSKKMISCLAANHVHYMYLWASLLAIEIWNNYGLEWFHALPSKQASCEIESLHYNIDCMHIVTCASYQACMANLCLSNNHQANVAMACAPFQAWMATPCWLRCLCQVLLLQMWRWNLYWDCVYVYFSLFQA